MSKGRRLTGGILVVVVALGAVAVTTAGSAVAGIQDDGMIFAITTGPAVGEFPADEFYWTTPVWSLAGAKLDGPVVYGGYGCATDRDQIPAPAVLGILEDDEESILVLQRGPQNDPQASGAACVMGEKVQSAEDAGYDAVLIANNHAGTAGGTTPDALPCSPPGLDFATHIRGICIGHRAMHALFGSSPSYKEPYEAQSEPAVGSIGERVEITPRSLPVLASHDVHRAGWTSYAVSSPGGTVEFPLRVDASGSPAQIGGWLYSENDEFLGGTAFAVTRSSTSYYADVTAGPLDLTVDEIVAQERIGMMTMTVEVTTQGPATFKILLWGAGNEVDSFQYGVRGAAGVRILASESGDSAFLYTARDFAAPVNWSAGAQAGGGARATVLGERVIDVDNTLAATYIQGATSLNNEIPGWGVQASLLSVTTPTEEKLCTPAACSFSAFAGTNRQGPGRYIFKLSGAGAGLQGADNVMLSGADARLPSLP